MTNKTNLSKGELMEELIRNYFLNLGYYVARGVKYKYDSIEITDIDLFLYERTSTVTRQRINVDIKNKKSPKAFERILWANGLRKLLGFDSCIVATSDKKPVVQKFGLLHDTIVLDGTFLARMRTNSFPNRLTEEEVVSIFIRHKEFNSNRSWRDIYEESKSRLFTELDFTGFNSLLVTLKDFLDIIIVNPNKREDALRMSYLIISYLLITVDYILKDISFLEKSSREKKLSDGFDFGNLGAEGVDNIISIALQVAGAETKSPNINRFRNTQTDILKEYFSKNETTRDLFTWAKEFENIGYNKELINPNNIRIPIKGFLSMLLDYFDIERKMFFQLFTKKEK